MYSRIKFKDKFVDVDIESILEEINDRYLGTKSYYLMKSHQQVFLSMIERESLVLLDFYRVTELEFANEIETLMSNLLNEYDKRNDIDQLINGLNEVKKKVEWKKEVCNEG